MNQFSKKIAIIGKVDTGKSTFFQRVSLKKKAIIKENISTTVDRKYSESSIFDLKFTAIDTPGIGTYKENPLFNQLAYQTKQAILESSLVLFFIDYRPVSDIEISLLKYILECNKEYIVVFNKAENFKYFDQSHYHLRKAEIIKISAKHRLGFEELYYAILSSDNFRTKSYILSSLEKEQSVKQNIINIAICGRTNVGKSSFINSLIGQDRLVTGGVAGTTRDSIDIQWEYNGYKLNIFDTAGINRKSSFFYQNDSLTGLSVLDSKKTINFANVCLLILDASLGIEKQDLKIVDYILKENRALVIGVNKIDLIDNVKTFSKEFSKIIYEKFFYLGPVFISYFSSQDKTNLEQVIEHCIKSYNNWNIKISTSKLNKWILSATQEHKLPVNKVLKRRVKIKYVTQDNVRPPSFKLFSNFPNLITKAYKQYLINNLKKKFQLFSTPIKLKFVKDYNPYQADDKI